MHFAVVSLNKKAVKALTNPDIGCKVNAETKVCFEINFSLCLCVCVFFLFFLIIFFNFIFKNNI